MVMAEVRARLDRALGARIVARHALRYAEGPDPALDRPGHVRAGRGLARFGGRLAVVQDDADFVALVDPTTLVVDSLALPKRGRGDRQFDGARGNKSEKRDFEACFSTELDGREALVAFGSGSSPRRESMLLVEMRAAGEVCARVAEAPALYAALRACTAFSGSELNVEGAVRIGNAVRFFQRGNGAPRGGLAPVDATVDVEWPEILAGLEGRKVVPRLGRVVRFDLGAVSGIRLTFTDAAVRDASRVVYLAAAEASPDAVSDGAVCGAAVGVIRDEGDALDARYAPLVDERGAPARDKAEGILLDALSNRAFVVLDADDPSRASELCVVELSGPWWA